MNVVYCNIVLQPIVKSSYFSIELYATYWTTAVLYRVSYIVCILNHRYKYIIVDIYLFLVYLTLTDILIWTTSPDTTGVTVTGINELLLGTVIENKYNTGII